MPRPRRVSDEQILAMARECVLEHGPQVALDVIAERLGVTAPALLRRFGSRQALMLRALVAAGDPEWVLRLDDGPDDRPLLEQLAELLGRMSAYFSEAIPCMSALRESGIGDHDVCGAHVAERPLRGLEALARWLERAGARGLVREAEAESAATALLGAVTTRIWLQHMCKQRWPDASQQSYLRELAQLFSRALGKEEPADTARTIRGNR